MIKLDLKNEGIQMKDEILNVLTMEDVLNKYGIKHRASMFHCPFHKDENASAKMYRNSFYCFSCNRTGDLIQFVQYLFNLTFKEAMQKINQDFNLNLECDTKINNEKIREIEYKRKQKEREKSQLQKQFNKLCKKKEILNHQAQLLNSKININNWEQLVYLISKIDIKCELIDLKLDDLNEKISSR